MARMTKQYPYVGIKSLTAAGSDTVTDITLTGIATDDVLTSVIHFSEPGGTAAPDDVTDECSVTAANTIQCSTTSTAGGTLWVQYIDVSIS